MFIIPSQNVQKKYSCGPDGIHLAVLKECIESLSLPLAILFNKSLSSGLFPKLWKKSFIIPLYKSGAKNDVKNYRPIAMLSCIPKIFEGIITDVITFNVKSIISHDQHGFIRGRSTTTNLLEFVTYCFDGFNDRVQVDCVFTDFSKAFDKLSHGILLTKLMKIGFGNNFVSWIQSYLTDRSSCVLFENVLSNFF